MQNIKGEFKTELQKLVGSTCSKVIGTAGVGSMVSLLFGRVYEELVIMSKDSFPSYHSQLELSMDCASWRLLHRGQMICSSASGNGVNSPMEIGMNLLVEKSVLGVVVQDDCLDLSVSFSAGLTFQVFCDQPDEENYAFWCGANLFTVGAGSALSYETGARTFV